MMAFLPPPGSSGRGLPAAASRKRASDESDGGGAVPNKRRALALSEGGGDDDRSASSSPGSSSDGDGDDDLVLISASSSSSEDGPPEASSASDSPSSSPTSLPSVLAAGETNSDVGSRNNDDDINASSNGNDKDDDISKHSSEYFTAVSAARLRLRTARLHAESSARNLSRAKCESDVANREVREAEKFLEGVEGRWGVVDLVESGSTTPSSLGSCRSSGTNDGAGASSGSPTDNGPSCDVNTTSADSSEEFSGGIRVIEVSGAGDSIVDGTYNLSLDAVRLEHDNSNLQPRGAIYVHSEGPFLVQDEVFDVCIYQKPGYGTRARWCIGLVPCHLDDDSIGGEDGEIEQQQQQQQRQHSDDKQSDEHSDAGRRSGSRMRNFGLAYIYYWMEVDASSRNGADATYPLLGDVHRLGGDGSSSWRACHGARPVPTLRDATTRRRWWQFWK